VQPMPAPPDMSSNPFEILGLDREASFDDVKLAYRRLARQHHPDMNPDDPAALDRFTALRHAYERLKVFYHAPDELESTSLSVKETRAEAVTITEARAEAPVVESTFGAIDGRPDTRTPCAPDTSSHLDTPGAASLDASAHFNVDPHESAQPVAGASGSLDANARFNVVEPGLPGTGSRRAFHRSGAMRQSGALGTGVPLGGGTGATAGGTGATAGGTGATAGGARPWTGPLPHPWVFGGGPVAARAEIITSSVGVPAGDDPLMYYALVGLRASDHVVFPRVPLNLCLVLDHSSSMLRGGKVDQLKETVREIIDGLDEEDLLSIVTFGDRAEVLLPAQLLRDKALVHGAIDAIHCRGGTEIARGLAAGLAEIARNASRALSHLILLTDGQTRGDELACLQHASEAAAMNVGITAYGLGADWNSMLLDGIAAPTGGYSDHIASPHEMAQAFGARVLGLQSTTLHKVSLAIRPEAGVGLQRATVVAPVLRPMQPGEDAGGVAVLARDGGTHVCVLGDIGGTTEYRVLLEFVLGPRRPDASTMAVATLTFCYDVPGLQRQEETLAIPLVTAIGPEADAPPITDPRVAAAVRHMTIHRLQQQAWQELTTQGNLDKGTRLLTTAAEHLRAAGHADLAAVALGEASRVAAGERVDDESVKRITYGTRKLG